MIHPRLPQTMHHFSAASNHASIRFTQKHLETPAPSAIKAETKSNSETKDLTLETFHLVP